LIELVSFLKTPRKKLRVKYTKSVLPVLVGVLGSCSAPSPSNALSQGGAAGSVPQILIKTEPGQKLIGIDWRPQGDHAPLTLWLQTREAQPDDSFGSIRETQYDTSTGRAIRTFLIVEQEGEASSAPADDDKKDKDEGNGSRTSPRPVSLNARANYSSSRTPFLYAKHKNRSR
jgi:hypothetical protein